MMDNVAAGVQRAKPLHAQLLINYDLPASRELHLRRIGAVLGAPSGSAPTHTSGGRSGANAQSGQSTATRPGTTRDAASADQAVSGAAPTSADGQQHACAVPAAARPQPDDAAQGAAPRRTSTIHFVVAGQMAQFRALEKFTHAAIHEMPVHAADILGAA